MRSHHLSYFLAFEFVLFVCLTGCQPEDNHPEITPLRLKLLSVSKIWDQAPHNAFTDLTRFKDQFFCVFREASAHVSPDGTIRVLSSHDGDNWERSALLALDGYDLRDPKIVVHSDGKRLMINGGAAVREGKKSATLEHSFVSFSADGREWSTPEWVGEVDEWLWRVTWFKGKAYGIAYSAGPKGRSSTEYGTSLLVSADGDSFRPSVRNLYKVGGPTEATIRFDSDGTAYCLQRRDGREVNTALLGVSNHPYKEWGWTDLGRYFGGPNFIQIPSGHWVAAGRFIDADAQRTVICRLDVKQSTLLPLLTLPSGGDTSYPGMIWYDDTIWVSYYSSHEGKTSIYLAKVVEVG